MESGNAPKPKKPRKRKPRGRGGNTKSEQGGPTGPKRQLPTPQIRITIRNIQDAKKHATCADLKPLIGTIIDKTNEKLGTKLVLDTAGLDRLIEQDAAVRQARIEFEHQLAENAVKSIPGGEDEGENKVEDDAEVDAKSPAEPDDKPTYASTTTVISNSSTLPEVSKTDISTRVLYIVPPKQTRRRGERPGCIYLVLTAPSAAISQAQRRAVLMRALECMTTIVRDDVKAQQEYAGSIVVQEGLNDKAWKVAPVVQRAAAADARLDGTIFATPDYKQFMQDKEQSLQERLARPRPAPGGGVVAAKEGPPVAALVQHLLAQAGKKQKQHLNVQRKVIVKKETPPLPPPPPKKSETAILKKRWKKKTIKTEANAAAVVVAAKSGP
jgi:hypothetical protein